jgi:predicted metal-dependent peptidase
VSQAQAADPELEAAEQAARAGLESTAMMLPHLSGLAHLVKVSGTARIPTAAVFPSGRIVVNPKWFLSLPMPDQVFVLAHEVLHLALRTHERCEGSDARLFNIAHDYIINDMLRESLDCPVPAQGLDMPGASKRSAEEIVADLKANVRGTGSVTAEAWGGARMGSLGEALARAGAVKLVENSQSRFPLLDVLDASIERQWFPGEQRDNAALRREQLDAEIDRALALGVWHDQVKELLKPSDPQPQPIEGAIFNALRLRVQPPWELALQRWLEDAAPGERTFARASRRQGDRSDIVLPGHRREGWTLNLILDTSGSMWEELAKVLGIIAGFCEAIGIAQVRILQCSTGLELDEIVAVESLAGYRMLGGGGSDLRPGFQHLAADAGVDAAVVITDGMILYPAEPMPYAVLWTLVGNYEPFAPPYGRVIRVKI